MFDLVIRGGRIVNAAAVEAADVAVVNGKIAQIGGEMRGVREIEAGGRLLLPGGIDAHVHLSSPPAVANQQPRWVDDFSSGSAAALAGGVTTLGNMTFLAPGEMPLAGLLREAAEAQKQTIADLFLHPVITETTPEVLDEIPGLLAAGCNSIKFFMAFPAFDAHVAGYVEATRRAGASGLLTLIHCEDGPVIADSIAQLVSAGRTSLRDYALSRPVVAEVVATQRAVAIAEATI